MGASHVDAIEIDPAIAFLGQKYHPERPYDDTVSYTHLTLPTSDLV